MNKVARRRTFENVRRSDVVRKLAQDNGYSRPSRISRTSPAPAGPALDSRAAVFTPPEVGEVLSISFDNDVTAK